MFCYISFSLAKLSHMCGYINELGCILSSQAIFYDFRNLNTCRKFEDIFDVDHFIDYLKNDVRIVRDIPEWFTDKSELFTSIRFDFCVLYHFLILCTFMCGLQFVVTSIDYLETNCHLCYRRTVKNIPKYAPAQFYIDNVLPRIKEKKIMALKPFVDRLG
jgi:type III secretory pathway component EscU